MRHLLQLSIYWFGITAIWGGLNGVILPKRLDQLDPANVGVLLATLTVAGVIMAILVQPTIGVISDYTISRWGRRKPYIVIGTCLDVVFLVGIATSQAYLAILAFVVLLQFSSNFAQGPFQGYVPDLVPARQVGLASGLMGVMIVLGRIGGTGIGSIGLVTGDFVWPTIALGLVEFATMVALVVTVDEGTGAPPRTRSWLRVATSAWGLDILKERNVLWLLAVRLFVLATIASLDWIVLYLTRSHGLSDGQAAAWLLIGTAVVGLTTAAATYPSGRLSDRYGRKRLIYLSCATGSAAMVGVALAPNVPFAIACFVPFGIASGAFLAVDWALMTDVIPKETSGRYMGILNAGTAAAGPLGLTVGGLLLDRVGAIDAGAGPRAAMALAVVFFGLGALALRRVDERRRET